MFCNSNGLVGIWGNLDNPNDAAKRTGLRLLFHLVTIGFCVCSRMAHICSETRSWWELKFLNAARAWSLPQPRSHRRQKHNASLVEDNGHSTCVILTDSFRLPNTSFVYALEIQIKPRFGTFIIYCDFIMLTCLIFIYKTCHNKSKLQLFKSDWPL